MQNESLLDVTLELGLRPRPSMKSVISDSINYGLTQESLIFTQVYTLLFDKYCSRSFRLSNVWHSDSLVWLHLMVESLIVYVFCTPWVRFAHIYSFSLTLTSLIGRVADSECVQEVRWCSFRVTHNAVLITSRSIINCDLFCVVALAFWLFSILADGPMTAVPW